MEALDYFKNKKAEFACNRFNSNKEGIAFCEKLYKLGATKVDITIDSNYSNEDEDDPYADTLVVNLPKGLSRRIDLMAFIFEVGQPDEISSSTKIIKKVNWKKDKQVVLWWD